MCSKHPGPRCSGHTLDALRDSQKEFAEVSQKHAPESLQYVESESKLRQAQYNYNCSPDGINAAKEQSELHPSDLKLRDNYEKYAQRREQQVTALAEIESGRVQNLANVFTRTQKFYDTEEMNSIIDSSRRNSEKVALHKGQQHVDIESAKREYDNLLSTCERVVRKANNVDKVFNDSITTLRKMEAPTSMATLKAYSDTLRVLPKSKASLKAELVRTASLQNVKPSILTAYYDAYRQQYNEQFAHLGNTERPDPPKEWVYGSNANGYGGYKNDPKTVFAPSDPASMYALYRLRTDSSAIPDYMKTSSSVASVHAQESPEENPDAQIILNFANPKGKTLGSYTAGEQGRTLKTFIPELRTQLQGKRIVAASENSGLVWLMSKLNEDTPNHYSALTLADMNRKYLHVPAANVQRICEKTGSHYDPENMAQSTVEAFINSQKQASTKWRSKKSRRDAPPLKDIPLTTRW